MANFLGAPKVQFFDDSGEPLSGGKLYSYISGTTTAKATYSTLADAEAGTNANANPVILDSRGEATVVLTGSYKLILKTSADAEIWSVDAIGTTSNTLLNDVYGNDVIVLAAGGSNAVNYLTVTNATTGNDVLVTASGTDTNVDLKVASKGSGTLLLDAGATGAVDIGTTSTGAINLKRNTAVTGTLSSSGAATLNSATVGTTLGVTGASTLASVAVTGAATVGTTLGVTGTSTLAAVNSGNTAITGTLSSSGAATLNSAVITNSATIGTTLAVTGNTTLSTMNTFTYPSSDGTAGQVLKTNGSKVLSFTSETLRSVATTGNLVFRATAASQTLTKHASTSFKLSFNTETIDTGSCYDHATNYRYTPTVNGYYRIQGYIRTGAIDNAVIIALEMYKNGLSVETRLAQAASANDANLVYRGLDIDNVILLNGSTDYVELYCQFPNATDSTFSGTFFGYLVQAI